MNNEKTFRFTEIYLRMDDDNQEVETGRREFLVNTRLLPAFITENDFAYGYVEELIEHALKGSVWMTTSRKYCFGDLGNAYDCLNPGADCQDPVVDITIEVG
jgi:hypothetical protein